MAGAALGECGSSDFVTIEPTAEPAETEEAEESAVEEYDPKDLYDANAAEQEQILIDEMDFNRIDYKIKNIRNEKKTTIFLMFQTYNSLFHYFILAFTIKYFVSSA